jgi:hypothetical protein
MTNLNELAPNNASTNHQGRLSTIPSQLLPPTVTGLIFDQIQEHSLVAKLGRSIPVTYGQTVIPITTKRPEVGQVGTGVTNDTREGGLKPLSGVAWSTKSFSPIKLATIVTVSEEFAQMNPAGLFDQIQGDLAYAIGRGIDMAVFHGTSPLSGSALQGIDTTNVISNTTNAVNLVNGNIYNGLLDGYDLVNSNVKFEFNGWAVDPRFRTRMLRESVVTAFGTPNAPAVNLSGSQALDLSTTTSQVLGLTAHYGRAVRGDLGACTSSGIQVIGGDFNQLAYGFADQIRVKISDTASLSDGTNTISMFQTNQLAILVEVTFGWVLGDPQGFVAFTDTGVGAYTLTVNGAPTGGSFTVLVNGVASGSIAYNATPAAVKTALVTATGLPSSDVVLSAGTALSSGLTFAIPATLAHGTDALTGGTSPTTSVVIV